MDQPTVHRILDSLLNLTERRQKEFISQLQTGPWLNYLLRTYLWSESRGIISRNDKELKAGFDCLLRDFEPRGGVTESGLIPEMYQELVERFSPHHLTENRHRSFHPQLGWSEVEEVWTYHDGDQPDFYMVLTSAGDSCQIQWDEMGHLIRFNLSSGKDVRFRYEFWTVSPDQSHYFYRLISNQPFDQRFSTFDQQFSTTDEAADWQTLTGKLTELKSKAFGPDQKQEYHVWRLGSVPTSLSQELVWGRDRVCDWVFSARESHSPETSSPTRGYKSAGCHSKSPQPSRMKRISSYNEIYNLSHRT